MKKSLLLLLVLSFMSISAKAQKVDALGIKDSSFVPIFVGGWGSCDSLRSFKEKKKFGIQTPHKMFLYEQAVRYVQNVNQYAQKGIEKFVLVCATKGSQNGLMALGSIRMKTYNVDGQEVSIAKRKSALVNLDSNQDNSYREFIRLIPILDQRPHLTTKLLEIADGKPMVVFGHSYGGWISKRIIEIIAAPEVYEKSMFKRDRKLYKDNSELLKKYESFPIHTFFSLEGISAVRCRITNSIKAGAQDMRGQETHLGCRDEFLSFHQELNLNEEHRTRSLSLADTAGKLENWFNILLKDSELPTRAGIASISEITNIELDIAPYGTEEEYEEAQAHPFKNAHHMLGFHTDTWQKICELTLKDETLCNPIQDIDNKGRATK